MVTTLTKAQIEERLKKDEDYWQGCLRYLGRENIYTCRGCQSYVVTVNNDPGTTPVFLSHKMLAELIEQETDCTGTMYSGGYPKPETKPPFIGSATLQWVRKTTYTDLAPEEYDYIIRGGLSLTHVAEVE
jgi:hypothetical protein